MFTGIVAETGTILEKKKISGGIRFKLRAPKIAPQFFLGDSVAIDGCCLTVVSVDREDLEFDLSPETLSRTIAEGYKEGAKVNLESSLCVGDKMGGHFVTGHVDTVARVLGMKYEGDFSTLSLELKSDAKGLVAEKGSIAVNGVSLTVASWNRNSGGGVVDIALIPATLERTNLGLLGNDSIVNIEYDLIARYLAELNRKD